MTQLNLSQQATEWIEQAIVANVEEFERLTVSFTNDNDRQTSKELDELSEWINELEAELHKRQNQITRC